MTWNLRILISVLLLMSAASRTQAEIYEWAYVDPSDPTQGVYQSSVPCPGGGDVSAIPSSIFSGLDLTQAYLIGANLNSSEFNSTNLTNANLTNANVGYAILT